MCEFRDVHGNELNYPGSIYLFTLTCEIFGSTKQNLILQYTLIECLLGS